VVDHYITVIDEVAPVVNIKSTVVDVECSLEPAYPAPMAFDNSSGELPVSNSMVIIECNCTSGYTEVVTYTATDVCGRSASVSFTINHQDTRAPIWNGEGQSMTYEFDTAVEIVTP